MSAKKKAAALDALFAAGVTSTDVDWLVDELKKREAKAATVSVRAPCHASGRLRPDVRSPSPQATSAWTHGMPHHSCGSPRAVAEPCTAANLLILQLSPATGRTRWEFSAPENNYSVGSSRCHKNLDVVNERHEHLDIRDSAAKGLGVFSRRSIAAGECIIAELPLVSVCGPDLDPSCCRLDQIVSNLCDADQRDFYALCSRGDEGHNALCI